MKLCVPLKSRCTHHLVLINAAAENVRNLNETPPIIQASGGCTQDFTAGTDGIRQEIHGLEEES